MQTETIMVEILAARMERMETGYRNHEHGYEMTDEQLASMNRAIGLVKDKTYRPYCLRCADGPRMVLKPDGFWCWNCGNKCGFDLKSL